MKCTVYIAASLDGYIATEEGGVEWLDTVGKPDADLGDEDMGWAAHMNSIDCLIMGRHSMEKVSSFNLPPDQWPYGSKRIYCLSNSLTAPPENLRGKVEMVSGNIPGLISKLDADGLKHAYVDGGSLITSFLKLKLINEMTVTIAPVLLGKGKPLFGDLPEQVFLENARATAFANDFVQVSYNVRYAA